MAPANSSFDVRGKIVVVTGAASGIGAELCNQAAGKGAKVVVLADLNLQGCESEAARALRSASANGHPSTTVDTMRCDAGNERDIQLLISFVETKYGPIDLFVANAGVALVTPNRPFAGIDTPDSDWKKTMDVNFMQSIYAARHLIPRMVRRGGGAFLITASAAGLLTIAGDLPYAVSKGAAVSLAEWLALTYGQHGVNVSVLCPLGVHTGMTKDAKDSVVAMNGMLTPEEVGKDVFESLERGDFLILPHKVVKNFVRIKGEDRDRFIKGQRKLNDKFYGDEKVRRSHL